MMSLLIIFAFIFVFAPIAQAYARRMNQPQVPGASPADVARLREEMDQLVAQVTRLQDEHSFMLRLLTEGDGAEAARLGPVPAKNVAKPADGEPPS